MMEVNRMELFEKITCQLGLGKLTAQPEPLSGGYLHRMFSLETERGKYAVKLLNPYIMKRDSAMKNYRRAEELEAKLESRGIPILPALTFSGKKMQETDGQYYYLFDWFAGSALKDGEIETAHCQKMGRVLAEIHAIERRAEKVDLNEFHGEWNFYLERLSREDPALWELLQENLELIRSCQEKANAALCRIPEEVAICHDDMDSKNVLWRDGEFRIIDLECLSYDSPYLELYDLALNWAGYEECRIEPKRLRTLVDSYGDAGGLLPQDWVSLYYVEYIAKLDWLEYNLKRTLGIEGGSDEKQLGASMVKWAVRHIRYYAEKKDIILGCLTGQSGQ